MPPTNGTSLSKLNSMFGGNYANGSSNFMNGLNKTSSDLLYDTLNRLSNSATTNNQSPSAALLSLSKHPSMRDMVVEEPQKQNATKPGKGGKTQQKNSQNGTAKKWLYEKFKFQLCVL